MSLDHGLEILDAVWHTTGHGETIGAVAIRTAFGKWKAYIGLGTGASEELDKGAIAVLGSKLPKAVAVAYFPQLDPEQWTS